MVWKSLFRRPTSDCTHPDLQVSHAAGMERSLCRLCGAVTIHYRSEVVQKVDRAGLARRADAAAAS